MSTTKILHLAVAIIFAVALLPFIMQITDVAVENASRPVGRLAVWLPRIFVFVVFLGLAWSLPGTKHEGL